MTAENNFTCEYGNSACSQRECSKLCPSHPEIWTTISKIRIGLEP